MSEQHKLNPWRVEEMRQWSKLKLIQLGIRLFLGSLFIYASLDKILHPSPFSEVIYNYQIVPDRLINLTATILPWLELVLGLYMILGIWLPGTVFLTTGLLAVFWGAIFFNMIRGLDISCGCFMIPDTGSSGAPMLWYVIRDSTLLLLSSSLFYWSIIRKQ